MTRLLSGAVAGAVATVPMTAVMEALHARLPGEPRRPLPPREITEAITVKAGVDEQLSERDVEHLTLASHVGYGAVTGALFGLLSPRRSAAAIGAGVVFGLGVWAASYLGWLPALGVRHSARHDPPARTGLMVAAHVVWGASMGILLSGASESGRR